MTELMPNPCGDCVDGYCTMNCGPAVCPSPAARAKRAIEALRKPDHSLARVPNTIRQSIAEIIEELLCRAQPAPAAEPSEDEFNAFDIEELAEKLRATGSEDDYYVRASIILSAGWRKGRRA